MQRFKTKQGLIAAAVAHGWDALELHTREVVLGEPDTPQGAVNILSRLTEQYGGIESYADKLRVLREDLRSPEFRARGHAWVSALGSALDRRFAAAPSGIGLQLVAQWQGALLLWAFAPTQPVQHFMRAHLTRFVETLALPAHKPRGRAQR